MKLHRSELVVDNFAGGGPELMRAAYELRLDLTDLAREAGVSERTLVSWARGKTRPNAVTRGLVESAIRRLRRANEPPPSEAPSLFGAET